MGYDVKFGKVEVERGEIPEDEPVFVLRARDRLAVGLLLVYKDRAASVGSPIAHVVGMDETIAAFESWQRTHETQVPD